jgi:hypothetical protein
MKFSRSMGFPNPFLKVSIRIAEVIYEFEIRIKRVVHLGCMDERDPLRAKYIQTKLHVAIKARQETRRGRKIDLRSHLYSLSIASDMLPPGGGHCTDQVGSGRQCCLTSAHVSRFSQKQDGGATDKGSIWNIITVRRLTAMDRERLLQVSGLMQHAV